MTTGNEHLDQWLVDLRSGEFKQGFSAMLTVEPDGTERYCPLGIACKRAGVEFGRPSDGSTRRYSVLNDDGYWTNSLLPDWLSAFLGLSRQDNFIVTQMNDRHKLSFTQIADIIEYAAAWNISISVAHHTLPLKDGMSDD